MKPAPCPADQIVTVQMKPWVFFFFFGKIAGAPLCYLSRGNLGCSWGHSTWQDLVSFVGFTC